MEDCRKRRNVWFFVAAASTLFVGLFVIAPLGLAQSLTAPSENVYVKHYRLPYQNLAFQWRDPTEMNSTGDVLWFTEYYGNRIGQITTGGIITEYALPKYTLPERITIGPDGAPWFTSADYTLSSGHIRRITPNGNITEYPLPANVWAGGITAGGGALWFTAGDSNSNAYVGTLTLQGVVTLFPVSSPYTSVDRITYGPDGALWVTGHQSGTFFVGRMTTSGVFTTFTPPTNNSILYPTGITVGPDGAVWCFGTGLALWRIETNGMMTEYPFPVNAQYAYPVSITPRSDGTLWFSENRNVMGRMTVNGDFAEYQTSTSSSNAGVAFGSDSGLWFSEAGYGNSPGAIGRLAVLSSPDVTPPLSHVLSLPATENTANFSLQWAATDKGSGVRDFTIYVSDGGGPYTPWLVTALQQGAFPGVAGHTYSFFSVARDLALNQEPLKVLPDASTQVALVIAGDLNGDGSVNCDDLAIIRSSFGKRSGQPGFDPRADVNHDGVVDVRDLAVESQLLVPGIVCK